MNMEKIGIVKSEFEKPVNPEKMKEYESTLVIDEEYARGLEGLEVGQSLQVIFNFHLIDDYKLFGPKRIGEPRGVFASRSPKRPNGLGVTAVELLAKDGNQLRVKGLDAIDGTPILDIKSYSKLMDQVDTDTDHHQGHHQAQPRTEIEKLIEDNDLEKLLLKAGELHGHFCPFVSLGVKAAAYAMQELDVSSQGMEEIVAVVETNSCFSDGIQYVTGCTFGNNALIYRDYGKTAVTVATRDGTGIRLYLENYNVVDENYPEASQLFDKVIAQRNGSAEEEERLNKKWQQIAFELLEYPIEELFKIEEVEIDVPDYAPIKEDKFCSECGEKIMAGKEVTIEGEDYCVPCMESNYLQLDGRGLELIGHV
ncbi:tRNA (N6-threonylcarbamoyladenosine(37)-N6)-methyltransferase TrmO [Halanaerobacter jeridensis]|nr:tRNA (N6-threonylcarbamoyladenosine(37)-N6)-methyltransferase TrmO [Halanaerobacter jeridensis]